MSVGDPPEGTSPDTTVPERALLEEERDFLLRSLDDLEREREAGDVDDADYEALKDGYTSRAAEVLRALAADSPSVRRTPSTRRAPVAFAWVALVLVVALVSGWLVARSSGERLAGQTPTGNVRDEDSVSGLLAEARSLLSPQDPGPAIDAYGRVLDLEPDNVEALTYLGWLSVLSAFGATDDDKAADLFQTGLVLLRQATTIDDTYADPHCFLGIAFDRAGDQEAATPEFERCLELDPPADTRQLVEAALERVSGSTSTTTP